MKGEPGAANRRPLGSTTKLSICEVPATGADEAVTGGVEEHVAQAGAIRDGDRRVRDRRQLAAEFEAEAGSSSLPPRAGVRDVDETVGETATLTGWTPAG